MGNDQWSYEKVLPFFRKCERDLDMRDDLHGTDGPMPVRRRQERPVADIQKAFRNYPGRLRAPMLSAFTAFLGKE